MASCGLRRIDDPATTSLAWPGADPVLVAASRTHTQLELFSPVQVACDDHASDERWSFDPVGHVVRRITGKGLDDLLDIFFARWHYEGRSGMRGPAFGLYQRSGVDERLVGVYTFARICNPNWASITFLPSAHDLERLRLGLLSPMALRHRLVAENEYRELNRLALAGDIDLGRGAVS